MGENDLSFFFCIRVLMYFFPQAFELATGDYLFEPHSGEDYSRDEGWCGPNIHISKFN